MDSVSPHDPSSLTGAPVRITDLRPGDLIRLSPAALACVWALGSKGPDAVEFIASVVALPGTTFPLLARDEGTS